MNTLLVVAIAALVAGLAEGSPRTLLQSSAPPNPSFSGSTLPIDPSLQVAGTTAKINWRGVGTQNFSSSASSQYVAAGAVADMFLQNGTKVGQHFFVRNGDGSISPAFTRQNAQGQLLGTIVATPVANTSAPAYNDDGGYGSIPTLLLKTVSADGFFAGVTNILRTNTLGGIVPGNPKLFTLPASPAGVANFLLCVPYQADYLFLAPGSPPPTTG